MIVCQWKVLEVFIRQLSEHIMQQLRTQGESMTPIEQLKGMRGKDYFDVAADMWEDVRFDVIDDVNKIHVNGKLTVGDVIGLADKHQFPVKTFIEMLEKEQMIPTGCFDEIARVGVGKLRKQLREKNQ